MKNSSPRVRGGTKRAVEEAYRNLGYAVVEDCCAEWLEASKRIKKLRVKERLVGLTARQETTLRQSIAERVMCEMWLYSSTCYEYCGYDGKIIVQNLEKRLKEKGY